MRREGRAVSGLEEAVSSQRLEKERVAIADIPDVVVHAALYVADIAGIEVCPDGVRASLDDSHLPSTFDVMLPLIRIQMPAHLAHAAGMHGDQGGRNGDRGSDVDFR